MPARLVYAPKVWCFTKDSSGNLLNVSDYVVSGRVDRQVNQASTASVTLRNPNKRFTTPSQGVAFHPMDPITIFLQRLEQHPVQVFTGYLDETPYYQMYPGEITITATCTLKRLLYTYFDPSLPYVFTFFKQFGWVDDGQGSLTNLSALGNTSSVGQGKNKALQDGSIAKLLYATLRDIGQWDDTNIWIEPLPSGANGIAARMATLMNQLLTEENQAAGEFTAFMHAVVGTASQGSGGGTSSTTASSTGSGTPTTGVGKSTGNVTSTAQIVPTMKAIAEAHGLPPLFVITVWLAEGMVTDGNPNSAGARGYFQFTSADPYPGIHVNYPADAVDLGIATNDFCNAAVHILQSHPSFSNQSNWETWAEDTQQPGAGAYASYWSGKLQQAQGLLNQYGNNPSLVNTTAAPTSPANSPTNSGTSSNPLSQTVNKNFSSASTRSVTSNTTSTFTANVARAGTSPASASQVNAATGASPTTTAAPAGQMTRFQVMVAAANAITAKNFPYFFGGGHGAPGIPTGGGFDCSGAVSAVMFAAGLTTASFATGSEVATLGSHIAPGLDNSPNSANIFIKTGTSQDHTFMQLGGRYFGTSGVEPTDPAGGPGWFGGTPPASYLAGFQQYHVPQTLLAQFTANALPAAAGGPGGSATVPGGTSSGAAGAAGSSVTSSGAEAFTASINFPSIVDTTAAILLGQEGKGLMHDQTLLPFVQQLTQASMRSFQSLPNGDFFAFYPDYFGEMNAHPPYWEIDDIEILEGNIYLSDDALVTHEYAVGDNTYPQTDNQLYNELFSAGTITIFNAFLDPTILNRQPTKGKTGTAGTGDIMSQTEAVEFIKRYGARPHVGDYPMVRSPMFEMFLAYQQFMLSWSNQFKTPFTFTFMPELFPGGKVAFPGHGLQMYVNSVSHTWDFSEQGFTTTAELSAPAAMPGNPNPDIPPDMVRALVEPIASAATTPQPGTRSKHTKAKPSPPFGNTHNSKFDKVN